MMLLKKIRHLNNFKNELVNQIVEIKSLKSKIEDLENKVKKQEEDLEFLKTTMLKSDSGDPEQRIPGLRHLIFKPDTLTRL